jgi:hypothetical protein
MIFGGVGSQPIFTIFGVVQHFREAQRFEVHREALVIEKLVHRYLKCF